MNIACLGWGSLIWKPGPVPVAGEWYTDGPEVPIEFSRVGDGGELATAVCFTAPPVPVFWSLLTTSSLAEACDALREREQIPAARRDGIGLMFTAGDPEGLLPAWAAARNIDAVIWTALPPKIDGSEGRIPSRDEALAYLSSLTGETRDHAMNYIEQVPPQLDTPYRRAIRRQLGWGG
ncbi:hypothetical protein CYR40_16660 [Chimaeribacter arupi]|uniref:Uncharacterized protein n=2 Tax=Yersiniaceae TaxID=1903411 RepID=A0A2N5ELX2_9GAMM|nr:MULTISPECIES: hypothetical protein [Yersiniaceae]MBS0967361.1 hypothetical protein [Nissabacter archeti]MDV5141448.1 hypothetical protein [Chimaeribacter arupi]PLR43762.1 hypothetical protein CYR40_16660 [Chimaeribacter arupi]PLR44705.1 hypothetical protein CYR52_18065 [Chimaeribacter arupi]PLR48420.1 hypothetical protein CYR34_13080 [Chimaeribacter arupi]